MRKSERVKPNPVHAEERYGRYHETLQRPGVWQLFRLAVEMRRDVDLHNRCAGLAAAQRHVAQKHRAYGMETQSQHAWVLTLEGLCEALGFERGTEAYRDVCDLSSEVALGYYRVPHPGEDTDEQVISRFLETV